MDTYELIVRGQLDQRWAHHFADLRLTLLPDGSTLLSGPVVDQAALHGLLARIRDLGLPLLLVRALPASQPAEEQ
ncbi:MAG TPA: hypothetical protein PKD53_05820 [Chloroflexaceae bacterium]|nr:hypothetical protein [Chloroflexaceae bacterium]